MMPTDRSGVAGRVGKPEAAKVSRIVAVPPNGSYDLQVHAVTKLIGDSSFPMLSYNGSIPGPTLRVRQGSQIAVNVLNGTEMDTTVHWHGLRLENRYDGVPHETQAPIPPGGRYTHRLTFPDAGLFWYHPHISEHYAQELGLYGNIIIDPADSSYWPPVDREVVLTLDDILIEDGEIASLDPHMVDFAAMGRYGNVLLVSGETEQHLDVRRQEVLRLYLTNTANTRVFKVVIPRARMKLVGADGGRYERERSVDDVVMAPSERAIVDVIFDESGTFKLQHVTPGHTYRLATFSVDDPPMETSAWKAFPKLRDNADMVAERNRIMRFLAAEPDKTLALVAEMALKEPVDQGASVYVCPMHPDVVRDEPGSCPKCGMKLMPQAAAQPKSYSCPMHPDVVRSEPGKCPKCGMTLVPSKTAGAEEREAVDHDHSSSGHHDRGDAAGTADGIEWEDDMLEFNRMTTSANMRWKLVDRDTGKENAGIDWTFIAGDQVKIRLVNEMESDHPMHHPFHIHGERFLVLARDGREEPNLVWKDTVLIPTGQVVDILMDASNPGLWMAHCHIAEHMESGMMFSFRVRATADHGDVG